MRDAGGGAFPYSKIGSATRWILIEFIAYAEGGGGGVGWCTAAGDDDDAFFSPRGEATGDGRRR